jgi:predicted amidophosphoribosyltransferase
MTTLVPPDLCPTCKQALPRERLLCANCQQPIDMKNGHRWHHDGWSRAVHVNCSQPTGWPKLKKEVTKNAD